MNECRPASRAARRCRPDGVADLLRKIPESRHRGGYAFEICIGFVCGAKGWTCGPRGVAATPPKHGATAGFFFKIHDAGRFVPPVAFPLRAPSVMEVLRQSGARPAVVFHDFTPSSGWGIVGLARAFIQRRVSQQVYARSALAVFTVPVEQITWLPQRRDPAVFIPVGSPNFPALDSAHSEIRSAAPLGILPSRFLASHRRPARFPGSGGHGLRVARGLQVQRYSRATDSHRPWNRGI